MGKYTGINYHNIIIKGLLFSFMGVYSEGLSLLVVLCYIRHKLNVVNMQKSVDKEKSKGTIKGRFNSRTKILIRRSWYYFIATTTAGQFCPKPLSLSWTNCITSQLQQTQTEHCY